jgi:hypothetical protein
MIDSRKMHIRQFESISTQIRMLMMKVLCSSRKRIDKEIQLTQEDKLIVMLNNKKMHSHQFDSVLIQRRMLMMKALRSPRKRIGQEIQLVQEDKVILVTSNNTVLQPRCE